MTDNIQKERIAEEQSRRSYSIMSQKIYDLSKFTNKIQLDYIKKYTTFYDDNTEFANFLPNTKIIEEIYNNWQKCYRMKDESDFDKYINNEDISSEILDQTKFNKVSVNLNKIHDFSNFVPEIINEHFHYGNINMKQVTESFKNRNFTNSFKFLDKMENINKPLSVSKLNIGQFLGYILYSRTKFNSNMPIEDFNSHILKQQINKDVIRQSTYINDKLINDEFTKDSTPPYFYSNIFNLYLLEIIEKVLPQTDDNGKYDLMNICSISTIQHVVSWYTDSLISLISGSDEVNTPKDAQLFIDFAIPSNDDYYDNDLNNKYFKIYIDERTQTVTTVSYCRILCMSMVDPTIKNYFGYAYFVIEFNIPTNTIILKYVCIDYDLTSHNKFIDEMIQLENRNNNISSQHDVAEQNNIIENKNELKQTILENKSSAIAGTLLTMGALSAIPLALFLGGKITRRRFKGEKRRKTRQYKRRFTKNKKYKNKNKKRKYTFKKSKTKINLKKYYKNKK
jgi:hypothetical protein